jgi:outer membrane biosynthesis protein TonB
METNDQRIQNLIDQGLARYDRGILVPIIRGGSQDADPPFPEIPEDLAALSDDELQAFADDTATAIEAVGAAPQTFVNEARTAASLLEGMEASVAALETARAELSARDEAAAALEVEPEAVEPDVDPDAFEALRARAQVEEPEPEAEVEPEPEVEEPEPEAAAAEVVVAAAAPARRRALPRPAASRAARPADTARVALTAAGGADLPVGSEYGDELDIATAMIRRHSQFGRNIPEGVSEKMSIAHADWTDLYPAERTLGMDEARNEAIVAAAINPRDIRAELERRRKAAIEGQALVASGGLCAPVTPYYQLQLLATAGRPVRASLAAFNADRGGIRYARPAGLGSVTTGVGSISAASDGAGGTFATKTCQVVPCPPFQETDVAAIFHCLQFGNLGARTFPERVAQWNSLTLAAHARLAEAALLTGIDTASTQVTAGNLGLGASAALLGQVLAAANGIRNRNRMDPEAVLRLLMPDWAIDLLVSDVIRGQFQRFDTDEDKITALLRSFDIEPTFYIDGAAGKGQVFGTQTAGVLLPFPPTVTWYLFPEGSFLYLDGGVLELGLVRDSVLNQTNDFQIFGETFENVAFVGVESLAITSTLCDSGVTSGQHSPVCPTDYHNPS